MSQLDRSAFSATEFRLDLTVGEKEYPDYGFQTLTLPGLSEATTTEFKLNNESRNVITAPGTANNFSFDTSFTTDWFEFREAAQNIANYSAKLYGIADSAFEGVEIYISGKVASPGDLSVGVDNVPIFTFNGTTAGLEVKTV